MKMAVWEVRYMRKELLDDIIELKETRKILEAACGENNINRNTFSKGEKVILDQLRRNVHLHDMLRDVKQQIEIEEAEFKNDSASRYL